MGSAEHTIIDGLYRELEGSDVAERYADRHGIESAAILTNYEDEHAHLVAAFLGERVYGKTVVEIGGGIGLLGFHLSAYAARVFVIEAAPAWSWAFLQLLYARKPKNVSFLFGAADEFAPWLKADVAIFCTHSGRDSMRRAAGLFAPTVIDVYAECAPESIARLEAELGVDVRAITRQQTRPPHPPRR